MYSIRLIITFSKSAKFLFGNLAIGVILFFSTEGYSQANYEEQNVPEYALPRLLTTEKGLIVTSADEWINIRRPELLNMFEEHVYGVVPDLNIDVEYKVRNLKSKSLPPNATVKEVIASFIKGDEKVEINILIFLPKESKKPTPIFVGLNFHGNQVVSEDKNISITKSYAINSQTLGVKDNKPDESSRGIRADRWPVEDIIKRGYGLATIHCGDMDPDFDDGFKNGIHKLMDENSAKKSPTIAAWAWGLSRALDYFEKDEEIDHAKVAAIGHSRLGKASLWAGATDQRFAMVISNDSGCGGAALSKRSFGETIARINTSFPHWFNSKFKEYSDNEVALPIDQHMLIALMAPRPVYVASAQDDKWADPKGEYLSIYHSGEAYTLFGAGSFEDMKSPDVNKPRINGKLGYHMRTGGHDITPYDWDRFMDFADIHLKP
ncbi:MAG: acetylxylan esterase [Cyclobacteriaceae bacterium]|jgi:hypothetical protein|nr:acetylxylan esterase [Cyclobacteriaceae bacterium]